MGLIECLDCGNQVSDQAPSCIHCGRPLSPDLVGEPSAGSFEAMKKGRQRSRLRSDLAMPVAMAGVILGYLVAIGSGSFAIGWVVALVGVAFGLWVGYGS